MFRAAALVLLALCASGNAATPPGHYDRAAGLSGGPLKATLHEIVRGHTVIPYAQLHAPLARLHEDPVNPNNVVLLYSADSVAKGTDFISAVWNREHAWPRSRGNADETGPDDSDLHYIWPCYDAVNSARGNLPFDLSVTTDPQFRAPAHPLAPRTSLDRDSWEPPPGQRGALARCLFYVAVRYDGDEPATSDMELVSYAPSGSRMGNLNTLLRWHFEEPVTDAERRRNDMIYSDYQRNRNPFIDHPEWVPLIWGDPLDGAMGSRPIVSVTAPAANASEQPRYTGEFRVTLGQAAPSGNLTIAFRLTGSATATDYSLTGSRVNFSAGNTYGTLQIPARETIGTVTLVAVADGITETAETATLILESGVSYTVVPNASESATVTINDLPVLPAAWHFDAGAPFPSPLPAETGNALLSFEPWRGTITSFSGVTGDALALVGSEGNGSSVLISLSMAGQRDLAVQFQTRGTATGFSSGTWAWSIDGATFTALAGANTAGTSASFAARNVNFSSITALNNATNVTLRYTLSGATSSSGNARIDDLAVHASPISVPINRAPQIVQQSGTAVGEAGGSTRFFVSTSAVPTPTYQWFKDGVAVIGGTGANLSLPFLTESDGGTYTATITNALGQARSAPMHLTVQTSSLRLINVASRAAVGSGDAALIAGFVIGGTQMKPVLIRGAGPALENFGVTGALADPRIELYRGDVQLAENDDWPLSDSAIHTSVGAFAFAAGSKDAALMQSLAPGAYTVQLWPSPKTGPQSGIGLIEIFELPTATVNSTTPRLINLSTRAFVGSGQDILIPGLVIGATGSIRVNEARAVLIRAIGPGLADHGVTGTLEYPRLKVVFASGAIAGENIGWQSAAKRDVLIAATTRVGAFPLNLAHADSALLLALAPEPYTIHVSGADGGSGIALVEVYEVP